MNKVTKKWLFVILLVIVMAVPYTQVMAKDTKQTVNADGIPVKKQGDWWYYILKDKSGAVVCGYEGKSVHVKIPKKLGGKKVTIIDSFGEHVERTKWTNSNKKVKSIIVPDTVMMINDYAFRKCRRLEKITLSKKLKFIGCSAFSECDNLKNITIPNGVTSIEDSTFWGCSFLRNIELPNNLKSIGFGAFNECIALKNIDIPDSVTTIGGSAFANCASIESISIPNGVKTIELGTFSGCHNLSNIVILPSVVEYGLSPFDETKWIRRKRMENSSLVIVNNVLIDGQAATGSVTIPSGVKKIYNSAFSNNTRITEIIIPEGVEEIGRDAFSGCTNLEKIEIPTSVTDIGEVAFANTKWFKKYQMMVIF